MAFLPLIDEQKVKSIACEMNQPQTYPNYPY
jgi:hypothetical protein